MSKTALYVKNLLQDMVEDRKLYISLNGLLERQRENIISRQVAEVDALNERAMVMYKQLAANSQKRLQILNLLGISANGKGMHTLFSRLPAPHKSSALALWNDLEQQAKQCQNANEYNGTLLNMQQDILVNLLNASEPANWLYTQG